MKADVKITKSENNTKSYSEIKKTEGIYEPIGYPNTRVVVIHGLTQPVVLWLNMNSDSTEIVPAETVSWRNDRFIVSSDEVTVIFKNK